MLRDADYLMALEHAPDGGAKAHYEEEAKRIAEIQRGILAVSAQEAPDDGGVVWSKQSRSLPGTCLYQSDALWLRRNDGLWW